VSYPRDFFDPKSGASPANEEAAALLWSYRKDRPKKGIVETEPPDGAAMVEEIETIRNSLRNWILRLYIDKAREVAEEVNLVMRCGTHPKTPKDLKNLLCTLDPTNENQVLVYQVCHEFHRDRNWVSNAVDSWLEFENIVIIPTVSEANKSIPIRSWWLWCSCKNS
jgi:hypothetical protein